MQHLQKNDLSLKAVYRYKRKVMVYKAILSFFSENCQKFDMTKIRLFLYFAMLIEDWPESKRHISVLKKYVGLQGPSHFSYLNNVEQWFIMFLLAMPNPKISKILFPEIFFLGKKKYYFYSLLIFLKIIILK